jgi:hypothetical protein
MSDQKLSEFAKNGGIPYISAWRAHKDGKIVGSYQDSNGNIFVKNEPQPQQPQVVIQTNDYKTPDFNFKSFAEASSTVRNNKAGGTEIPNRFQNIDSGILPTVQTGNNKISCKDIITLMQKSYHNISIMRQIIDLIVDLSVGKIFFRKGNKKSRDFFDAYWETIGGDALQEKYYLGLWREGQTIIYPWKKELKKEDVLKIVQTYGMDTSIAAKKITLPAKFVFLNPADIQADGVSSFTSPTYYKVLNGFEIASLKKKDKTQADQELFDSLPKEIQKQIMSGLGSIMIPLPMEDVIISFYKKMDFELFATPVFFPVLDDLNFKMELKKQDLATLRMMNQAILLFTMGAEPDKGGINYNNINNLQQLLSNSSVARYLVCDYTTKGQFLVPDIGKILGKDKYAVVENDIYIGLNYILLNGEKFANKMTAIKIFLAKIRYGQNLFIRDVLKPIIENVSKQLGFKSYPEPYFEYVAIEDDTEFNRLVVRMAEIGALAPKEVLEYFDNGKLPLWDESKENQEEFKGLRDKGWYEPITGGPETQKTLLDMQNKQATKTQTTQLEHDDKQGNKQRKHEAENPQAPAPQIVLKAPTKLAQPSGRPSGSKRKKSTNKPRVVGSIEEYDDVEPIYSGAKLMEVIKKYDLLEKSVIGALKNKFKVEDLKKEQSETALELAKIIARNEDVDNWENNDILNSYIEKPLDKNEERILEIEEISASFGLEPHLGTLLFYSKKEENKENQEGQ